ncbi:PDDEXK nuclease domain-containing protein [Prosthecobacter sp. SYSU 5D2]|uniref:PDDEXK nuclease domain-containing protein n=1 Tax=Prosthecobacter sp. SYSU 5D2 TaxID=3134134 RepID=UPI0031FF25BC
MKTKKTSSSSAKQQGYKHLVTAITRLSLKMSHRVASVANQGLVLRNWTVGAYIVEFEQGGADRAKYGERLLEKLAEDLAKKNLRGLDERTLRHCRAFSQMYPQLRFSLNPQWTDQLSKDPVVKILASIDDPKLLEIRCPADPELKQPIRGPLVPELPTLLPTEFVIELGWAKLLEFMRISDPWKRAFYENQCLSEKWSKRELQRQIESLLYERTGLSTHKKAVIERARKQAGSAAPESIAELMRDPYILEFTGLAERPEYSENDLESALLDHLQRFLLELGNGFCFEARQFRMTEGRKHHRVDLVFYHRVLRCHVLLDLKTRAFKPEDAGQMNFYLNWFKARMKQETDIPPVGILLCTDKEGTEVEFATAGMDQKLFVSRYLTALPTADQLKNLVEADRAQMQPKSDRRRPL